MDDTNMEHDRVFVGREALSLSEEQAREFLETIGYGVLALADEPDSYAFPASFGFDGEDTLYFQFGTLESSEKEAGIQSTRNAAFVTYDIRPPEWQSVIVRGPIKHVSDENRRTAYEAHRQNAWVPLNAYDKPLEQVEFEYYKLEAKEITGYGTQALK